MEDYNIQRKTNEMKNKETKRKEKIEVSYSYTTTF
jgi:hypothetical protein